MRHGLVLGLVLVIVAAAAGVWMWRQQVARPRASPGEARRAPGADIALPDRVGGWTAAGASVLHDPDTIYDYIDGHAEVYRAYGMTRCVSRRYAGPGGEPDLVVDVFELASPEDAFGVFTHDREGDPVAIGRDGLWRPGWLSFWQDRYFVSIVVEGETDPSRETALGLGRALAASLPSTGTVPAIVTALPATGLDPRSVRFLRHPQILNTHVFVSEDNVFGLAPDTAAALGRYRHEAGEAHLLLVEYPDASRAAAAAASVQSGLLGGRSGIEPTAVGDRGYFAVRVQDRRVAAVLGATTSEVAHLMLAGLGWE